MCESATPTWGPLCLTPLCSNVFQEPMPWAPPPSSPQVMQPLFHERIKMEQDLVEQYNTDAVVVFIEVKGGATSVAIRPGQGGRR